MDIVEQHSLLLLVLQPAPEATQEPAEERGEQQQQQQRREPVGAADLPQPDFDEPVEPRHSHRYLL